MESFRLIIWLASNIPLIEGRKRWVNLEDGLQPIRDEFTELTHQAGVWSCLSMGLASMVSACHGEWQLSTMDQGLELKPCWKLMLSDPKCYLDPNIRISVQDPDPWWVDSPSQKRGEGRFHSLSTCLGLGAKCYLHVYVGAKGWKAKPCHCSGNPGWCKGKRKTKQKPRCDIKKQYS